MSFICCSESPADHEAHLAIAQLKSEPIQIWWYRRRRHPGKPQRPADGKPDRSPFPISWSLNFPGKSVDDLHDDPQRSLLEESERQADDDSSVFHEQQRDAFGNCTYHPNIQLARRKRISPNKLRFMSALTKPHTVQQEDEWDIIHAICPECEKEHVERSKAQYHYKPEKVEANDLEHDEGLLMMTHVPFPASLSLVDCPQMGDGKLALRVRTGPIPKEQIMHLSCASAAVDGGEGTWEWSTPDGALDVLLPADSSGAIRQKPGDTTTNSTCKFQIMERSIPIDAIDHVSQGGDAWDVLRQSTGENDFGCRCDVKVHGFSDRLLKFDVVDTNDSVQSSATDHRSRLRYSFAGVDFSSFSLTAGANNKAAADSGAGKNGRLSNNTTPESIIKQLNCVVEWNRQARKQSVASWMLRLSHLFEECLGLGVTKVDGEKSIVHR